MLLTKTHDKNNCSNNKEYIDGVKVTALASTVVDRGCESQSGCMCCFSANHASVGRKCTDCLSSNADNVSE